MTESEKLSNFTINAAAATGKFRVKPHLGQCQCVDKISSHSNSLHRLSYGLGYQRASVDKCMDVFY
jgi:hypothetical protein